jgi:hypothetical protein
VISNEARYILKPYKGKKENDALYFMALMVSVFLVSSPTWVLRSRYGVCVVTIAARLEGTCITLCIY